MGGVEVLFLGGGGGRDGEMERGLAFESLAREDGGHSVCTCFYRFKYMYTYIPTYLNGIQFSSVKELINYIK